MRLSFFISIAFAVFLAVFPAHSQADETIAVNSAVRRAEQNDRARNARQLYNLIYATTPLATGSPILP